MSLLTNVDRRVAQKVGDHEQRLRHLETLPRPFAVDRWFNWDMTNAFTSAYTWHTTSNVSLGNFVSPVQPLQTNWSAYFATRWPPDFTALLSAVMMMTSTAVTSITLDFYLQAGGCGGDIRAIQNQVLAQVYNIPVAYQIVCVDLSALNLWTGVAAGDNVALRVLCKAGYALILPHIQVVYT